MSTTPLDTNFKDDILASSNAKRKYQMTYNDDGTVSFQDVTAYSQMGSAFGAKEVNEERAAINKINSDRIVTLDEIDLVTEPGFFVDAMAVKQLNRKLNVSVSDIVNFTPLAGQNYPNWGGCYYYKSGSRVHVHLGIQGLPANQVATVFVLPEAVHPKTRIFSVGSSGSFPGVARTEIALDGGINVTSQDTYAAADIEYDTY